MRNTMILLALTFVAALGGAGFLGAVNDRVRVNAVPTVEPVNFERVDFYTPEAADLMAADPEGWEALVNDPNTTPEQIEAWGIEVRQQLFERKYGHRYELED